MLLIIFRFIRMKKEFAKDILFGVLLNFLWILLGFLTGIAWVGKMLEGCP